MTRRNDILEDLFSMRDEEYRAFFSRLVPTVPPENIIGIRTPLLRKYAESVSGSPAAESFLARLPHRYLEENNLHAFLIERMDDFDKALEAAEAFLPHIDNWGTCDSFRPRVFRKHPDELLLHIRRWIASGKTYTVRFGLEMLMCFYLDDGFSPEFPKIAAELSPGDYYIDMMVAWYFASALFKRWDDVIPFIEEQRLPPWTHNKAIQKALESRRITPAQKSYLRTLKTDVKK